jgi:glycosyltransferase involved in cell wall biosynthesis
MPAILAARCCGLKAILDLGEHYPGMMEVLGKQHIAHHIVRNRWLIRHLEIMSVKSADLVWVVADENRDRLAPYASRIEVINNYPALLQASAEPSAQCAYSPTGKPVSLVSLGLIDNIRGLDLAVEAFAIVVRSMPNVEFVIYGDGPYRSTLEQQVKRLNLNGKLRFGGWVSPSEKYSKLASADIGILLHKVCDLTQHTIPNKLFDYMYAGLPVISTKLNPVMRILALEACGIAVNENPEAVAAGMSDLIANVEKRRSFAANGVAAVHARYTWGSEAEKVSAALARLASD